MIISELLSEFLGPAPAVDALSGHTSGRTAELRRKFASRLAELSGVRLRSPASEHQLARLCKASNADGLPEGLAELYSVADGEASSGFFAPELEFLRSDYAIKLLQANDEALSMGLLPHDVKNTIPIFRDSVGNQIVVTHSRAASSGLVGFVDMEQARFVHISKSVGHLICRLVQMKKLNEKAGFAACPGDFRHLTQLELDVAGRVESNA